MQRAILTKLLLFRDFFMNEKHLHLGVVSIYMAAALHSVKIIAFPSDSHTFCSAEAYSIRRDCFNESNFGCIITKIVILLC